LNRKLQNDELNRLSEEEFKISDKVKLILILDNIRSLNNVGSIFRTADAFLIEAIFLCGLTGKPPHRDIQKTALGATETVHWEYFEHTQQALEACRLKNYGCYAVEQTTNSIALDQFPATKNSGIALVFGSEVGGVDQNIIELCDGSIEIPQRGFKHSLNVAVSAGIVCWAISQKMPE
jgi:23S rRNA (guanosine2251-2'-O)-methyltransferase